MVSKQNQSNISHSWCCCCSKEGAMWWGLALLLIGLFFIADDLGWINLGVSVWAIVILVIGIVLILWSATKR